MRASYILYRLSFTSLDKAHIYVCVCMRGHARRSLASPPFLNPAMEGMRCCREIAVSFVGEK